MRAVTYRIKPTHVLRCHRKNKRHVKHCQEMQNKKYLESYGWYVNPVGRK